MYTIISVRHDARGPFFDQVRKLCDGLQVQSNGASLATHSSGIYVCYSPDGIDIKFGTRVLRMPDLMQDEPPVRVRIEDSSTLHADVVNRTWRRERAWASMTGARNTQYLTVWGLTLGAANRLYEDILAGIAAPVPHRKTRRSQPQDAAVLS